MLQYAPPAAQDGGALQDEGQTLFLLRSIRHEAFLGETGLGEPLKHTVECIEDISGDAPDDYTPQPKAAPPSFVVARLTYEEFPMAAADRDGQPLWHWLDDYDGGAANALYHLQRYRLRDEDIDGVLCLRELHVRPSRRGHHLGLQLLNQALEYHAIFGQYLALLEAAPIWSIFEPATEGRDDLPPQPPEAMRAMQRYYRQIGFRRCYPKLSATAPHGAFMYRVAL